MTCGYLLLVSARLSIVHNLQLIIRINGLFLQLDSAGAWRTGCKRRVWKLGSLSTGGTCGTRGRSVHNSIPGAQVGEWYSCPSLQARHMTYVLDAHHSDDLLPSDLNMCLTSCRTPSPSRQQHPLLVIGTHGATSSKLVSLGNIMSKLRSVVLFGVAVCTISPI